MYDKRRPQGRDEGGAGADVRRRADQLVKDTGIPRPMAFQVAMGKMQLNDALRRLAMQDRVEGLIRQHELPRSLAAQIALGQAELDQVLRKRRLQKHLDEHGQDSILVRAHSRGEKVALAILGKEWVSGRVTAVDRYEFDLEVAEGETRRLHKLTVKVGAWARDLAKVRSQVKVDKDRAVVPEPIWRPQDRYGCSDKRLFSYLEAQVRVTALTLEGEILKGEVDWMGRWEFGMKLGRGVKAVVFRHALAEIGEG